MRLSRQFKFASIILGGILCVYLLIHHANYCTSNTVQVTIVGKEHHVTDGNMDSNGDYNFQQDIYQLVVLDIGGVEHYVNVTENFYGQHKVNQKYQCSICEL